MRGCGIAIGALLMVGGSASAEPSKHHAGKPATEQSPRPAVVLASADPVRAPAPAAPQPASAPVKRPTPRVTTCRCGDPQPGADAGTQEQ
jgi:hypothetical protein